MTQKLFLSDAYRQSCNATIQAVDNRRVILDQTVFYPRGGGQPGDSGTLTLDDGTSVTVVDTVYDENRDIIHLLADDADPPVAGVGVLAAIDWPRRYRHMRMHTCLHLLGVALPFGVTGGSIGEYRSRLDFDLPDPVDKQDINRKLNELIAGNYAVETLWTDWGELEKKPELIRTMSVSPPRTASRIRLLSIPGLDLQPCGGTHVRNSSEIGVVEVTRIEKKGSRNRRVYVELADP